MKNERRRKFSCTVFKEISPELLTTAYFFPTKDIVLRREMQKAESGNEGAKGSINLHTTEEIVCISKDTKGKLIELVSSNDKRRYLARIQFDADVNYSLFFESTGDDFKLLPQDPRSKSQLNIPDKSVVYNGEIYSTCIQFTSDGRIETTRLVNYVGLEFQLRETKNTVTKKAKGAW